eukprot:TRINITY_DN19044_c0_g1_i1.p1 TRINITY_DN19044_c0_g1~~TRINITY_DN19044_c0_g1_i1.p1  ORF type:complete len:213 (-),score=45.07 TRINITY_DN19044_c0_g1_i1:39-677(-)
MSLKSFVFLVSQPSRSITLFLRAANIEHEEKQINLLKGEQKTEEFLAVNPIGKVPAINDDGFFLSEGQAILGYLANSRNLDQYYPTDPKERAVVDKWMSWVHTSIRKSSTINLLVPKIFKKINPTEETQAEHAQISTMLNNHFESNKFIAGDNVSIADFFLIPELDQVLIFDLFSYDDYPNITRYLNDFRENVEPYASEYENLQNFVNNLNK